MMGIQNYRILKNTAYIDMAICAFGDVLFFIDGISSKSGKFTLPDSTFLDEINFFTGFSLIATLIGIIPIIFGETDGLTKDVILKVDSKMKIYKKFNVPLLIYILICTILVRDMRLIVSSIIMEASYYASTIYSRKMYELIITDNKLKWQKAEHGDETVNNEFAYSSILWRIKLWFLPREYVPMDSRYFSKANFLSMFFLIGFIFIGANIKNIKPIVWVIAGIICIIGLITILEYILGLYTSITGMCTGIDEFRENEVGGSGRTYYRVYVTDFTHKRELVFETYDYMLMYKDEDIKVIHGIFTKKPIMVNDKKIKYRSIL